MTEAKTTVADLGDIERRFGMVNVRWDTYTRLCEDVVRGTTRITYDRGRMEIVSLSTQHEVVRKGLSRIIQGYADVIGIEAQGLGSVTTWHAGLGLGLEPDECYYVANANLVIGAASIVDDGPLQLPNDAPPDLVVEVDLSPPLVSKQAIYAAINVPEVWQCDGRSVTILVRAPDGHFTVADRSPSFPDLPLAWVNELLAMSLSEGQSASVRELKRRLTGPFTSPVPA